MIFAAALYSEENSLDGHVITYHDGPGQGWTVVFTILVIFILVIGGMYQANEFVEHPDLPEDGASPTEKELREAVLLQVNEWRHGQNQFPTPTTGEDTLAAQDTARALSNRPEFQGPVVAGSGYVTNQTLLNPQYRCTQLALAVQVPPEELTADGSSEAAESAVAATGLDAFLEVDQTDLFERGVYATTGVGVAVQDSTAVVYRTCLTQPDSP